MTLRRSAYDDFVMDHIRNARNYRLLDSASREATGSNPLCGDAIRMQLHVARGRIEDAAYQCECCGISMASASMLTEWVKGRTLGEALRFVRDFAGRLAGGPNAPANGGGEMERALLATIREFPARTGCAALPWTTLQPLLKEIEGVMSDE